MWFFGKGHLHPGVARVSIHSHFDRSRSLLWLPSCLPSKKLSTFLEAWLGFEYSSVFLLMIGMGVLGLTSKWPLSMPGNATDGFRRSTTEEAWKRLWNPVEPVNPGASFLHHLPTTYTCFQSSQKMLFCRIMCFKTSTLSFFPFCHVHGSVSRISVLLYWHIFSSYFNC